MREQKHKHFFKLLLLMHVFDQVISTFSQVYYVIKVKIF